MGVRQFFQSLSGNPTLLPQVISIPNENTDDVKGLAGSFEPGQHYFSVRINEMFLTQQRKWFREFEPMVVCLTSYIYGEQQIDNPFIVGKNLLEAKMQNVPDGMLFHDTRVAGLHPYSGGRLIVSIALCKSETKNYITNSMEFVEKISGVLSQNLTKLVGGYLDIANVVIDGIDKLFDSKAVEPLFGYRKEFDPDGNDHFAPGYYVMIKSYETYDPNKFSVKENRLYYGSDSSAKEFRETEYVLFSVTRALDRSDIKILPVYQTFKKIQAEAGVNEVTQQLKDKLKNMLRVLNLEMQQSPDLTKPQAKQLIEQYIEEIKALIEPKFNFAASSRVKKDEWQDIDEKIASM